MNRSRRNKWKLAGLAALVVLLGAGALYHELLVHRQYEQKIQALQEEVKIRETEETEADGDAQLPEESRETKKQEEEQEEEQEQGRQEADKTKPEAEEQEAKKETVPARIKKTKKGVYTPYDSEAHWKEMSTEEKKAAVRERIPVRQDEAQTIERICTNPKDTKTSYSWILCQTLASWCREQGIEATEGFYLGYGAYTSQEEESFYVELNDAEKTIVLVSARYQGRYWGFEKASVSKQELQKRERIGEWNDEAAPRTEKTEAEG